MIQPLPCYIVGYIWHPEFLSWSLSLVLDQLMPEAAVLSIANKSNLYHLLHSFFHWFLATENDFNSQTFLTVHLDKE